jgi:hypothetical protein
MSGIRFRRLLVTIKILLMLFLIVLNANNALPPSLPPSLVLTSLLCTPDHEQKITFDYECFWFLAPHCLIFRSYKLFAEPWHSEYDDCKHQFNLSSIVLLYIYIL